MEKHEPLRSEQMIGTVSLHLCRNVVIFKSVTKRTGSIIFRKRVGGRAQR